MTNRDVNFHINKVEFMVFLTRITYDISKYEKEQGKNHAALAEKIEQVIEKLLEEQTREKLLD